MKCTTCQNEISPGTHICIACGHPVSADIEREDLYFSRLAAIAPEIIARKLRSAPFLTKERRIVTVVMFTIANIDGFEQKIPEDERRHYINDILDRFATIIFQYEGTIAKLWENTVLAFFGAPITHEDDPLRAIHAAKSILEEVQNLSHKTEESYGVPLQLKMVLNSGPILIGEIKSNLKFGFQSLNNTLECMDRVIQSSIPPCQIILFEDTYRFVKPFITGSKIDDITCVNINDVAHLWRVDQVKEHLNNLQLLQVSQSTALIGRDKQLELLLELSETVLAGLGRIGLILGEPGIGKSRLLLEWKRKIKSLHQPTQARWIQAHGLAFGRELAYHLLKGLLRGALDVVETTPKEKIKTALQSAISNMAGVDEENLYQFLAHLLDIQLADHEEARIHSLNASELRTQYFESIWSFFRNLAISQPLIIILEDLHWADASSIDLLTDLLSLTSSSPILICLASRQDRDSHGWNLIMAAREKFGPRLTEIVLENLNTVDSQSLVKQLIEVEEIPEIIRKMVLEKSEGNPFFIEELIRMLINEGVLVRKDDRWVVTPSMDPNKIPDSLQGLLIARIDRLPPEAQITLRIASVIGRFFSERVIESVMAEHAPNLELMEQLSTLESIGMIRVAQVNPELRYKFQHILLHDAAYHSIFEGESRKLHLSVGSALEKLYPDQKERLASQLALHFLNGQDTEKAYEYFDLAGHVSMEAFAPAEAEAYFRQAIELTQNTTELAHQYSDLGETLAQQGKHRDAIKVWKKSINHYQELGNSDRMARIYAWSARSAWWGYDPKHSLEICLEGLKALEGAVESPDIAYLIHETGRAYLFNNQPEKARTFAEQALDMAKRLNAFDVQAEALATIGILPTTKTKQAISALEMAIKISESKALYGPASRAYINLAAVIDNLGETRLARDYRMRAIKLGNKAGGVSDELLVTQAIANASLWLADFEDVEMRIKQMRSKSRQPDVYLDETTLNQLFLRGYLYHMKGDFTQAIDIFNDLIDRSRQIDDQQRVVEANRALAEVILEPYRLEEDKTNMGNLDITLSMINKYINKETNGPINNVANQCLLSNIYALKGNLSKSEEALKEARGIYQNQTVMQDRVRIILAQARLETAQNNIGKALELLKDTANLLEKMEARWWRTRIWLEIGILYLKRNEPEDIDQAQSYLRDALSEFKDMNVSYYPDVIIEKLRQVKHSSLAQAIAHRKVTKELADAGRVQHTFMPTHSPNLSGFDISGALLPARETSGDFYDFMNLKDGKLGVVIADVGDKGAGAALYMAMSRTLIRTYAGEDNLNPVQVIHEVNRRILTDTQDGIFLTAVFGVLDPEHGSFTYVNAGHNPPFLLKRQVEAVEIIPLEKTGTLVGIFSGNTWEEKTIMIEPGDVLVLYTDGITESQNEFGEFFGNEKLIKTMEKAFDTTAKKFRNAILERIQAFTGSAPRLDDITLIIISHEKKET